MSCLCPCPHCDPWRGIGVGLSTDDLPSCPGPPTCTCRSAPPTTAFARPVTRRWFISAAAKLVGLAVAAPTIARVATALVTPEAPVLVAKKLVAVDAISIELVQDHPPSYMDFVVDVFAEAIALEEDTQVQLALGNALPPIRRRGGRQRARLRRV